MFLLLLGYQHYDSGWTFIDIGPYSIDSMCHNYSLQTTGTWYIKAEVDFFFNSILKQCFTLEE